MVVKFAGNRSWGLFLIKIHRESPGFLHSKRSDGIFQDRHIGAASAGEVSADTKEVDGEPG